MKSYFNMFACVFTCAVGVLTVLFVLYGLTEGTDVKMLIEAVSEAAPAAIGIGTALASTITLIYWLES